MKRSLRGFTLVELIVVIVILGILSTIGFVSYNGYLGGARDSNRITQMKNINDALTLYSGKNSLPLPDNYYSIFTSPGNLIGYQGYAGQSVLEIVNYTSGGKDPKDEGYYTYYLSADRKRVQLLGYLEEADGLDAVHLPFMSQANAADYTQRFPKVYGKKLGVMTLASNNSPIQEDASFATGDVIFSTGIPTTVYNAYYTDTVKVSGTWWVLTAVSVNSSCERLKEAWYGSAGDTYYDINPTGVSGTSFKAYCDMTIWGGGWTLISSIASASTNHPKWVFGTQLIKIGMNNTASVPVGAFRNSITEMMVCSSQNCWSWNVSSTFKNCLTTWCGPTADTTINMKRVLGTTGVNNFTTTNFLFNITNNIATTFEIYNASNGLGVDGWQSRRPMAGNAVAWTWGSGEKWELYVR
jgi:prepilin-type N-terminal cleavage/methylation domain-containing protein